jgi:hypothetical protein
MSNIRIWLGITIVVLLGAAPAAGSQQAQGGRFDADDRVEIDGVSRADGTNVWPLGPAPIVVMTPTGEMSDRVWDDWLSRYRTIVREPGWDGTHTSLNGEWNRNIRRLIRKNHRRGKHTTLWLVREDQKPARARAMLERLVSYLDRIEHGWIVIGPTWDVYQADSWDDAAVNEWVAWAQERVNDKVLVGARALPDQDFDGDVKAWEEHVPELAAMETVLAAAVARSDGLPVWNTERFRVRNGGQGKDWVEADIPAGIRKLRAFNVGAIFGIQDERGRVNDYGSGVPRNPDAIRKALRTRSRRAQRAPRRQRSIR